MYVHIYLGLNCCISSISDFKSAAYATTAHMKKLYDCNRHLFFDEFDCCLIAKFIHLYFMCDCEQSVALIRIS